MTTNDPVQEAQADAGAMDSPDTPNSVGRPVPEEVIPSGTLPAMEYRDLPQAVPLGRMVGPSIILAGLALGSGEFIIWPKITFHVGFIFFWACLVGVTMQYFINMEITRWTLATGESAITGFCRMSRWWGWVLLVSNLLPWFIPAWSTAGAEVLSWVLWPEVAAQANTAGSGMVAPYVAPLAIASLLLCGVILTAGPVVYETVEKAQLLLVGLILILVVVLAAKFVSADAVEALVAGLWSEAGVPDVADEESPIDVMMLLGALAFAGVGGTLNLGQSNYIKDKGYGMGHYVGRITSPITGQAEAQSEVGYHFPDTEENRSRWQTWWRRASWEHFLSFFVTCVICLVLLSLLTYSMFYRDGARVDDAIDFGKGQKLEFVWHQATLLGGSYQTLFLLMGVAILFTTELCVLDATSRISADLIKVNWLRDNAAWTESRIYSAALWSMILGGSALLIWQGKGVSGFQLVKASAALNGVVMFLYCGALLVLNRRKLPAMIRMSRLRQLIMIATTLFFGFFAVWAIVNTVWAIVDRAVRQLG